MESSKRVEPPLSVKQEGKNSEIKNDNLKTKKIMIFNKEEK